MKASTVTFLALTFLVAFSVATTNTTNTTNATTLYCGTANGTSCSSWLVDTCCADFMGTKTNKTNFTSSYLTSFCFSKTLIGAVGGNYSLSGYTGTLACVNNGILVKVTGIIASLGFLALFF